MLPPLGPHQVRVRSVASALSHGTETLVYRGQVPADLPLDLSTLQGSFAYPIKYGYANVGTIEAIGTHVSALQPGDLVFVHHPHQTRYQVPDSMPIRLPDGLDHEAGVFFANLETALNVMLDAHPRLGEDIVIFGQGVVGLLLTMLARRSGAGTILAVDPLERRRRAAVVAGADAALSPGRDVPTLVRDATRGNGADLAIEASGHPSALDLALDCVAFQGTVVVCSWYGTKSVDVHLGGAFHRGRIRMISSQVGSIDPALHPRWDLARRAAAVLSLLSTLDLTPLISHRIPFQQAADAYDLVDRTPEEVLQVILTYGASDV
jgi:2-desacetyl-2-hydroxyethyl bacteriochlorophyllide A dehydrogenase